MLGKKILAGVFAVLILVKLAVWTSNPRLWLGLADALLAHNVALILFYLLLSAVLGYYAFSTLDLIDLAVVMFFTSLLIGLSMLPYLAVLLKAREEVMSIGVGRLWYVALIWGAIALAVLYRLIFVRSGRQSGKG